MLKNMFKKTYTLIDTKYKKASEEKEEAVYEGQPNIPQGLWRKCNKCGRPIYTEDVKNNFYICLSVTATSASMPTEESR